MKKVILKKRKEDVLYLEDIKNSDHVGFIDCYGHKGYVARTGKMFGMDMYSAISVEEGETFSNMCYGANNYRNQIVESLNITKRGDCEVSDIFVFEHRKALYRWLSE